MAEVIPLSLETPRQLAMSMVRNIGEDVVSLACVGLTKNGEINVSHNTMTPERMLYLGEILKQYAISI